MQEEILKNILKTIQDKIEADITKKEEVIIEDFKKELERYKQRAIGEVMSEVIISCSDELDKGMNYTITFRKNGDK